MAGWGETAKKWIFCGDCRTLHSRISLCLKLSFSRRNVLQPLINQKIWDTRGICLPSQNLRRRLHKLDRSIKSSTNYSRFGKLESDNNFATKRELQTNSRLLLAFTSRIWSFPITFYSLNNNHLSKPNSSHFWSIDSVSWVLIKFPSFRPFWHSLRTKH